MWSFFSGVSMETFQAYGIIESMVRDREVRDREERDRLDSIYATNVARLRPFCNSSYFLGNRESASPTV